MVITSSVNEVRSGLRDVPALPIQRILFPTDFSVSAEAAWPYAAGLASAKPGTFRPGQTGTTETQENHRNCAEGANGAIPHTVETRMRHLAH